MKPYPEYRPSGIGWIGDIPSHWEMRKVSRSFRVIGSGTTPQSDEMEYYDNGTVSWVITGDLNDGILLESSRRITAKALSDYSVLVLYPKGTLLIAMYGATIGKVSLLAIEACTNQACCALSGSEYFIDRFAFYWFLANKQNIVNEGYGGGQPNISQDIVRSLMIPCAPNSEQFAITTYLEDKTHKIDTLIEKKQRLIELLKEQRTAIINQAVTKGIKANVKMKDSGIKWIGEIPERWRVMKLKRAVNPLRRITYGIVQPGSGDANGIFMVRGQDYSRGWAEPVAIFKVSPQIEAPYKRSRLTTGDLLMTIVGAGVGNLAVVPDWLDGANITQTTARISLAIGVATNMFFYYLLQSEIGLVNIELTVKGAAQPGLNLSDIEEYEILIPPLLEQEEIVREIESRLKKVDTTIVQAHKEITLLREYRTALISEVVTGKVDVRDHESGKNN